MTELIPTELEKLARVARVAHLEASDAYNRLSAAVKRENIRRVKALASELKKQGLAYCSRCGGLKPVDSMQLRLYDSSDRYIVALCVGCNRGRAYSHGAEVRANGRVLEAVQADGSWRRLALPAGYWVYAPRRRVGSKMARRFGVLPTIRLNSRSRVPKELPALSTY